MGDAAAALASQLGVSQSHVALGGRSFGGRMGSMAVGDGLPALGLALVSYPLHPPGKPERLRTEHFPRLKVPVLFVSGTADPFGTPDELRTATAVMPAPTRLIAIDGAGHDLKRGRFDLVQVVSALLAVISP